MKTTLLIFFLLVVANVSVGQVIVNGTEINKVADLRYITVVYQEGSAPGTKNRKGVVSVETGQDFENPNDIVLKDKDGGPVIFNSLPDVLNHFYKNGWVYRKAFAVVATSGTLYSIILERRKSID